MKNHNRRRPRRWGNNDIYLWPFTFARDRDYKHFGVDLRSTDDEGRGCSLRVSGFGLTVICALPDWLVPPERKKVSANWDSATVARLGRDWYWDITPRSYGFSIHNDYLSVRYGRDTWDSSTEQSWGWVMPWCEWRFVRHDLYGLNGQLFGSVIVDARFGTPEYEANELLREQWPGEAFAIEDFDGECLTATVKLEEREWRLGRGWFKWLSWFTKPKVNRTIDIRFSGETGREKGSWKGGTIGHGGSVEPGDMHESAFARYCEAHEIKLLGRVVA